MTTEHDWLDKHIAAQASHWRLSTVNLATLFKGASEFDELLTATGENEPTREPQ